LLVPVYLCFAVCNNGLVCHRFALAILQIRIIRDFIISEQVVMSTCNTPNYNEKARKTDDAGASLAPRFEGKARAEKAC